MRMRWLVCALLVACGDDGANSATDGSCVQMSRTVTQEHGECRIDSCDGITGAACPGELEASCPVGWELDCEPSPEDPSIGINCRYVGTCTMGRADFVQTLDGRRGLIVMPDPATPGRCSFAPCL